MKATVLLSYFDPDGLSNMPGTAGRFKKPVPLLLVVGDKDPLFPLGSDYAFDKAPQHPASRYVVVQADHVRPLLQDRTLLTFHWPGLSGVGHPQLIP